MNKYENNIKAIEGLVTNKAVHRDVYVNEEIFKLEMENLFLNVWIFIGHASQIKNPGDFITSQIGNQPILVSRHRDQTIHVLYNRCPHKGVKIASEPCGNTGKFFRCPYHAWSFKTDGSLLAVPLKKGYDGTGFSKSISSKGLSKLEDVRIYKDFIFARLSKTLLRDSSNSFNLLSEILSIFPCLAFDVENIVIMSLVLVSPSQVIALNVLLIFFFKSFFKTSFGISASVKM